MTAPADSREAFEEWITTRPWFARAKMRTDKASDGSYKDFRVNDRWAAFQQGAKFGHDSVNTNV